MARPRKAGVSFGVPKERGADYVYKIKLRGNTFTLSFHTSASDKETAEGLVTHRLRLKYLADGNRAKKLVAITDRSKI